MDLLCFTAAPSRSLLGSASGPPYDWQHCPGKGYGFIIIPIMTDLLVTSRLSAGLAVSGFPIGNPPCQQMHGGLWNGYSVFSLALVIGEPGWRSNCEISVLFVPIGYR